jgi:hypothetical protein
MNQETSSQGASDVLAQLIELAANRRSCAVHYVRDGHPGICTGRVDGADSKMTFVATRSRTSAIPTHCIVSVVPVAMASVAGGQ